MHIGDSISTNGICLTVTTFDNNSFTVDVMPETMMMTNFKNLKVNDAVNLERALAANGRFGGHIVSGHIDGVGTIIKKYNEAKENGVQIGLINRAENNATFQLGLICINQNGFLPFMVFVNFGKDLFD